MGFTASAGWTFQGGEAIATPGSPTTTVTLTTALPLVSSHIAVLSRWRVDWSATAPVERCAGRRDRSPSGWRHDCDVRKLADRRHGPPRGWNTGNGTAQDIVDMLFDPASLYRAALKIEAAQTQCAVIGEHDTGAEQQMTTRREPDRGQHRCEGRDDPLRLPARRPAAQTSGPEGRFQLGQRSGLQLGGIAGPAVTLSTFVVEDDESGRRTPFELALTR